MSGLEGDGTRSKALRASEKVAAETVTATIGSGGAAELLAMISSQGMYIQSISLVEGIGGVAFYAVARLTLRHFASGRSKKGSTAAGELTIIAPR